MNGFWRAQIDHVFFIYGLSFLLMAVASVGLRRVRNGVLRAGLSISGLLRGAMLVFHDVTENYRMREMLRESEEQQRIVLDAIPAGVFLIDAKSRRIVNANPKALEIVGGDRESFIGKSCHNLICPSAEHDCPVLDHNVDLSASDCVLLTLKGRDVPIVKTVSRVEIKGRTYLLEAFIDITGRKAAEESLRQTNAQLEQAIERANTMAREAEISKYELAAERANLAAIFDSAQVGMLLVEADGRVARANRAAAQLVGKGVDAMLGRQLGDGLSCAVATQAEGGCGTASVCPACPLRSIAAQVLQTGQAVFGREFNKDLVISGEEKQFCFSVNATSIDSSDRKQILVALSDITDRKETEVALDFQARHDSLTGLPNRRQFKEALESLTTRGNHRTQDSLVVMFVDLDKFKLINDTLGHEVGDQLLIQVSQRLQSCLRDTDMLARMGGDEFTAVLPYMSDHGADADAVAARMLGSLAAPFEVSEHRLTVSASVGIASYPGDATDADTLLKYADTAMYVAKEGGRNRYEWYTRKTTAKATARMEIERDLRRGLQKDELAVHYQPIVDVRTGVVHAAEALLRWQHPERGFVSPGVFIPVAEESGLITQIGDYVARESCVEAKRWHDMGYPDVQVAVNISSAQFYDPGWRDRLNRIVDNTGLDRSRLCLEITETTLAQNEDLEIEILEGLRESGIRISIDDFGIGYSSFGRLKRFPVIHMKVDGSFIRDIAHSAEDRAMTESIISMAHALGVQVTAEWVETHEQMRIISDLGCDYAQGFLVSPPIPAEAFREFLRQSVEERMKPAA